MSMHLVADLNRNYARFVQRVQASKVVWGLKSEQGWAYCPSNESDCDVLLFWSDEAYARRLAVQEWAAYRPTAIDLERFIHGWLHGMSQDGLLVGVNFNGDLAGLEVEPAKLASELTS